MRQLPKMLRDTFSTFLCCEFKLATMYFNDFFSRMRVMLSLFLGHSTSFRMSVRILCSSTLDWAVSSDARALFNLSCDITFRLRFKSPFVFTDSCDHSLFDNTRHKHTTDRKISVPKNVCFIYFLWSAKKIIVQLGLVLFYVVESFLGWEAVVHEAGAVLWRRPLECLRNVAGVEKLAKVRTLRSFPVFS